MPVADMVTGFLPWPLFLDSVKAISYGLNTTEKQIYLYLCC